MAVRTRVTGAGGGWRRWPVARAAACASLFLASAVPGCVSPTRLRWPDASEPAPSGGETVGRRPDRSVFRASAPEDPAGRARTDTGSAPGSVSGAGRSTGELPPVVPAPDLGSYPIDLTTALRLAEVENPQIAESRQRVLEALAVQQQARALLLPTLNAGGNYRNHQGDLQRSSGRILNVDLQSLYFGGGAGASAASPVAIPAVNIVSPLTDAIFEPLAARQRVAVARFSVAATANRVLLEVAELHFELLAAESELGFRRESARQSAEVARLTDAYARAEQGRPADAERAATELRLIEREVRQAEEAVAVTSARLVRRLHLDPTLRVRPVAPAVETVTLVDPAAPLPGLIAAALRGRPEVAARTAAIAAAEVRHTQEVYRPFLPTVQVGFSGGVFGGGSNLTPPRLANFGGRNDFDVLVFWTAQNLGLGNLALANRRRAEVGQAVGERSRAFAEIRSEVSAAYAETVSARRRVEIATRQLASAEAGFREDLLRIRNVVGRPVEVVNSLRLLNEARVARVRAVTDFNKAEVRLFVALGSPPPLNRDRPSATEPLPTKPPLASPPVPPTNGGRGPLLGG